MSFPLINTQCRTKTLSSDNSRKEGRACSSAFSPSSRPSSQPQRPGEPRSPRMLRPCSRSLQCSFQQSHVPARPPHRTIYCAGRPCERCRPQIQLRPDVKLGRQGEGVAPSSRVWTTGDASNPPQCEIVAAQPAWKLRLFLERELGLAGRACRWSVGRAGCCYRLCW